MTNVNTTSKLNAEHYPWGNGCDGWHLLKSENLSVIQETMPPGAAEVPHCHERSRQFFFVLEGTLSILQADGGTQLGVGEGIHIAPGVAHRVSNNSASPVHFLVISSPPSHGDRLPVSEFELNNPHS